MQTEHELIRVTKEVDANADSKAIAIFFRQLTFSGKDSQHVKMFVCLFAIVSSNFRKSTNFDVHNKSISFIWKLSLQYPSIQMQISASFRCSRA